MASLRSSWVGFYQFLTTSYRLLEALPRWGCYRASINHMRFMHTGGVFALLAGLAVGSTWLSAAQAPAAIFTAAQAQSGRTAYQTHCASCHAGDLGGRDDAPALKGDAFLATWQAKPAKELVEFVSATMPPEGGDISPDDYLAIVAFTLQENGGAPGAQALTATTPTPIRDAVTRPQPRHLRN